MSRPDRLDLGLAGGRVSVQVLVGVAEIEVTPDEIGSVVVDGVIRCLGHNLEFDLATGTCLNARCDPLVTRSLVRVPGEAIDSPELEGF